MVDDEDRVVEAATWPAEEAAPVVDAAVGESLSMLCWGESMMENTMQLSARRVECVLVVYGDEGGGEAGGETGVRAHTSISLTSSSPSVAFARACSAACAERDDVVLSVHRSGRLYVQRLPPAQTGTRSALCAWSGNIEVGEGFGSAAHRLHQTHLTFTTSPLTLGTRTHTPSHTAVLARGRDQSLRIISQNELER